MKSRFDGMGYLLVDNRASGGGLEESDLLGCRHCGGTMRRSDWLGDGAICHHCDGELCGPYLNGCAARPGCTPFEERLRRAVDDQYRRRQNARILGI